MADITPESPISAENGGGVELEGSKGLGVDQSPIDGEVLPEEESHGILKSFLEHLEDLRWVLAKVFGVILLGWIASFYLGPQILLVLQKPLQWSGVENPEGFLKAFGPADAFAISFQLSLYAGFILSMPFVIYFLGSYFIPVLTQRERSAIYPAFLLGNLFFIAGVCFCYFVVLAPCLRISREFAAWLHITMDFWTVESYINFVTKFLVGMGVAFEVPLVILFLVRMGILNYDRLSKARPYVIVLNFILGAVLTTPEVFTQLVMAIPLTIMYEACIWISRFLEYRAKRKKIS
jgi:sec-independent protein translocase protein TatC